MFDRDSDELLKCYAVYLLNGNTLQSQKVKVSTLKGYFEAVNDYFKKNQREKPFDYRAKDSKAATLLRDQVNFEKIAERRLPLMPKMVYKIIIEMTANQPQLGLAPCIANCTGVGRIAGSRAQELIQDVCDAVRVYLCPDGSEIVRAATRNCVEYYDGEQAPVPDISRDEDRDRVEGMNLLYPMQKNRDNEQRINHTRNRVNPDYDICEHMFQLMDRAKALGQPDDKPLAVYLDEKDGVVKYLTSKVMTEYFREVAMVCMPGITAEDLSRYSAHSLRVTACVNLHEAGKDGSYIRLRLRWKSECYNVYLRNTQKISEQHTEALRMTHDQLEAMALQEQLNGMTISSEAN